MANKKASEIVNETLENVLDRLPDANGAETHLIGKKVRLLMELTPPIITTDMNHVTHFDPPVVFDK